MLSAALSHLSPIQIAGTAAFLAFLGVSWFCPRCGGARVVDRIERFGVKLAAKKRLTTFLIAVAAVSLRLCFLWLLPIPVPHVHDEFSYLLAGDTFIHGRLTNPVEPMWMFFDTIHVNQHPTYMSKYPPAQGMVLALGQLLGHPWIGVLLSTAVMCSAALWMMHGWLPARWALLGGIFVLLRFAIFSYWMNSYWGGAVPAIGGALVLGATPRIVRSRQWGDAVLLGLGAAILANSRPMEGLVLCLPVTIILVAQFHNKSTKASGASLQRLLVPLCATLLLCGIFMGYYNWRGTGKPLVFPYMINERTYVSTPTLFWEKARPSLHYMNPQFEAFYNSWMRTQWLEGRVDSVPKAVKHIVLSGTKVAYFFLWPELCLPLLALPWILRDRRIRVLVVVVAFSFLGFLLVPWTQAHYASPITAAILALVVQGIRHLRHLEHNGRLVGIGLSRVTVLFAALLAPIHPHTQTIGNSRPEGIEYRAKFETELSRLPGKHLVIVRYSPTHAVLEEWVYNRADIDNAKVVWVREIPGMDIGPLLTHFHGYSLWLTEVDELPPRLTHYAAEPHAP